MVPCICNEQHDRKRIVLTGGPGGGKTAILEVVRRYFCRHMRVLPEAAGILFGGGFPRGGDPGVRRAAQRAIFFVQRELEAAAEAENAAIVLCDRGTVDGSAYWPEPDDFWDSMRTTKAAEFGRYDTVVHLRTPPLEGYSQHNTLRVESAAEAAAIDGRIARAWEGHPRVFTVESSPAFLDKARRAIEILRVEMPECCRRHLSGSSEQG